MSLKDLLKRKDKNKVHDDPSEVEETRESSFTFMRSNTNTQELISPPDFDPTFNLVRDHISPAKHSSRFRSLSNASTASASSHGERRLSLLIHRRSHSHDSRTNSINVPTDLPRIDDGSEGGEEKEAQWERRATMLAQGSTNLRRSSHADAHAEEPPPPAIGNLPFEGDIRRPSLQRNISDAKGDDDIQEAIRLHEAGDLERSTAMFGRLADPNGANNALSQVLYGLALRHGWGIPADPSRAITFLSQAASNSASVESLALSSGLMRGGAAKGELVLAIYELANCFRHGWGVQKDPVAARSYYETAANLGDTDAMNEAARCYEEGFGGRKNKFAAAKYYRLAEEKGSKTLGNSWIWKDKYDAPLLETKAK